MQNKFDRSDFFDASDVLQPHDYSMAFHQEEVTAIKNNMVRSQAAYVIQFIFVFNHQIKVGYSGPLLTESYKVDELLQRNENHIREVGRRSRFHTGMTRDGPIHRKEGQLSPRNVKNILLKILNLQKYFVKL